MPMGLAVRLVVLVVWVRALVDFWGADEPGEHAYGIGGASGHPSGLGAGWHVKYCPRGSLTAGRESKAVRASPYLLHATTTGTPPAGKG